MSERATRILVVDDDKQILTMLQDGLMEKGYEIYTAESGEEALVKIAQYPINLIVLDIMLPGMSGIDVCKRVREQVPTYVPIIMISVKGNEAEKAKALSMGADDYVSKPFSMTVFNERLNAYLHDVESTGSIYTFGPLKIHFFYHRVQVNEQEVRLTPKEYKILEILIQNRGRLVTPGTLVHALWPGEEELSSREREIVVYIHNLRKKIERPAQHQFIITHHHMGYRFKLHD